MNSQVCNDLKNTVLRGEHLKLIWEIGYIKNMKNDEK